MTVTADSLLDDRQLAGAVGTTAADHAAHPATGSSACCRARSAITAGPSQAHLY